MTIDTLLATREDTGLPDRLARSAAMRTAGVAMATADFAHWFDERRRAHHFRVRRIPFAALDRWTIDPLTGNLGHSSGRFFRIEGMQVSVGDAAEPWRQPAIVQPEIGLLGILAKEFDGVLHFLMQAKMEPGNAGLLQLSPTVQATRSNYTQVHGGASVKYLDHFAPGARRRVIADILQSEHGSWCFRKSNRNMIVETDGDVSDDPDFCWLTLGQIGELLKQDDVVNMDARTVLACAPAAGPETRARHSDTDLLSWLTAERAQHDVQARLVPLARATDWIRDDWSITHAHRRFFRVVAIEAEAGNREVARWTQPLVEPLGTGIAAFLFRRFDDVPHLLVQAQVEGGLVHAVEIAPTVQCLPVGYSHLIGDERPPFLDAVLDARGDRIRYEAVHGEEGGRFLRARSRYLLVEAGEAEAPMNPPPGYRWVTPGQLATLTRHSHHVNVQARTLLSLVTAATVRL